MLVLADANILIEMLLASCGCRVFYGFAVGSGLEIDDGYSHRGWVRFLYPKKARKETAGEDFDFLPWTPLKTTKALSALGPALIALGV